MVTFAELYREAWLGQPKQRELLRCSVLHEVALELTEKAGLSCELIGGSRLARAAAPLDEPLRAALAAFVPADGEGDRLVLAHRLGQTLDALGALEAGFERGLAHTQRKKSGSFFTPPHLARALVERSRPHLVRQGTPRVCDPAVGGGAFLLEAARALVEREIEQGRSAVEARQRVHENLHGGDLQALPVWVSEVALWLYLSTGGAPLRENPRLCTRDSLLRSPPDELDGPFDWVVGNPPWVAFQGRAARPLAASQRRYYRENYRAFRGYPTLQGMFVERASELAPHGVISLLLPSSLSDLDGYRATRASLSERHQPQEPLEEYGQDAFPGVVQPCFGLVATPRASAGEPERPWQLAERRRRGDASVQLAAPPSLGRLAQGPALPSEIFRELGLQTNREVSQRLLWRGGAPRPPFSLALLEGRRVQEFACQEPALFLHPDEETLERTGCSLRPEACYRDVAFVVRQTAAFPIAAAHSGATFRNSLLAGYGHAEFDTDLLLGLLNSALFRAFHVAGQRDARQAAFPQVKLSHLRRLPRPPSHEPGRDAVREASRLASAERGLGPALRSQLDGAVFDLFGVEVAEREAIVRYLEERAPAALRAPLISRRAKPASAPG